MSTQKSMISDRFLDSLLAGTFLEGFRITEPTTTPDGHHFIDNDETLEKLAEDELSAEQRLEIRRHLCECRRCTDVFGEMVRARAIVVPDSWTDDLSALTAELSE